MDFCNPLLGASIQTLALFLPSKRNSISSSPTQHSEAPRLERKYNIPVIIRPHGRGILAPRKWPCPDPLPPAALFSLARLFATRAATCAGPIPPRNPQTFQPRQQALFREGKISRGEKISQLWKNHRSPSAPTIPNACDPSRSRRRPCPPTKIL